ncbi:hypothetical protein ADUPG1_012782, partial [Aduncisulcus paluster]
MSFYTSSILNPKESSSVAEDGVGICRVISHRRPSPGWRQVKSLPRTSSKPTQFGQVKPYSASKSPKVKPLRIHYDEAPIQIRSSAEDTNSSAINESDKSELVLRLLPLLQSSRSPKAVPRHRLGEKRHRRCLSADYNALTAQLVAHTPYLTSTVTETHSPLLTAATPQQTQSSRGTTTSAHLEDSCSQSVSLLPTPEQSVSDFDDMRDTIDALLSILPADYPALSRKQISSLSFLFPSFTPYSQRPHAPHFHKSPGLVKLGESRIDSMMGSRRVPPKCESVSPNMTTITIPSTPTTPSQNPSRIQTAAQAVASMSLRCDAASQLWDESKVSCDSIPSRTPKKEAIVSPLISSELMIQTSPAAPPQPVGGFRSRSHSIGTIDRDIVRESLNDVPPTLSNPYYGKVD